MRAAVRFPLGAAVTSRGQARHETDEQLDALREERGGKKHLNSLRACRIFDEIANPNLIALGKFIRILASSFRNTRSRQVVVLDVPQQCTTGAQQEA